MAFPFHMVSFDITGRTFVDAAYAFFLGVYDHRLYPKIRISAILPPLSDANLPHHTTLFRTNQDDAYGDDDAPPAVENYAILDGGISLNDDSRVVFSGVWAMKKDVDVASEAGSNAEKKPKKKRNKFKLKSKQLMNLDGGPIWQMDCPTRSKKKEGPPPSKRTMLFDGFFFTPEEEGHKKIKERDVEVTFSIKQDKEEEFDVNGKGSNEFGAFSIDGNYTYSKDQGIKVVCSKKYIPVASGADDFDDDDDDDDEMSDAAEADYGELVALNEEAEMSVEELRKRYYGGNADGDKPPTPKKAKIAAAEESDDECGF